MKQIRLPLLAAAMATSIVALSGCGAADSGGSPEAGGDVPTIRVAHNSNAGVLPARVAEQQGFFEDAGVNVEFREVENIATLPPAMGESFDIALSTPTLMISAASQGIPVVEASGATLDTTENSYAAILASKESGVQSLADLEGKRLGVLNESGTAHTATKYWMQQEGVDVESVEIVQIDGPSHADQLASGRVDAVETVQPFAAAVESKVDVNHVGDPYLEGLAPEIAGIIWIADKQWASENSETIEKYVSALDKAIEYIGANESDARGVLQEYTGLPDEVATSFPLPTFTTEVRSQDLDLWLEAMRANGFGGQVEIDSLLP